VNLEALATMARIDQNGDALAVDAPPLRLTFRWDGRRWAHDLEISGRTVASTVEMEPEGDDPSLVVSPAYQQLTTQDGPDGARALLVGQWGPSHCSAVFTVSEPSHRVVVEADVAVRSRVPLQGLASTYLVYLTSGDLADAGPSAIVWDLDGAAAGSLRFEATGPGPGSSRVGLAEAGRRATRVQASAELVSATATQRLRYRWYWLSNQGATRPVR
jgi:hypothetical protein